MNATALVIAALTLTPSPGEAPVYVLEHPGIAFSALPPELAEPVPGEMTEESGHLESAPNDLGVTYRIDYTTLETGPGFRRGDWLTQHLESSIIPGEGERVRVSDEVKWMEGSKSTDYREEGSVGLVPWINFNVIDRDTGDVLVAGRSAAVFRNGYVTQFTVIAPMEHTQYARQSLIHLMDLIYMTD
jgi:hypothetical protein